ncbi:MAG: copper chaperone PCu(A)C [Rhizobiaceae bacterium]
MKFSRFLVAVLLILISLGVNVHAHEYQSGDLLIEHPHITKPLPGAKVSAGYLEITNRGDNPERLIGVTAGFSKKSQLHSIEILDGVAKMRPVKGGIEIPPGGSVKLKKGGFHLMFMKVSDDVDVGQLRPVKLLFEKAGTIEVEMIVIEPADLDEDDDDHSNHSD